MNRSTRIAAVACAAAVTLTVASASAQGHPTPAGKPCLGGYDLNITNANILTLDRHNTVAHKMTVHNGRISAVGRANATGRCVKTINLHGQTLMPGLVDSHAHFVRAGIYPGYHADGTETATTIAQFLAALHRAVVRAPAGEIVTAIGGWTPNQFAEDRIPTRAELDFIAPHTPVYIQTLSEPVITAVGTAATNSAGAQFFQSHGVSVDPTTGQLDANQGFRAVQSVETDADRVRNTQDQMNQANRYGLTTVIDQGGVELPGVPAAFSFNSATDYNTILNLWKEHDLTVRVRTLYANYTSSLDPLLNRLRYSVQGLGDDYFRVAGIGEQAVVPGTVDSLTTAYGAVAANGWTLQQHSGTLADTQTQTTAIENVNAATPVAGLRWSLAHVWDITPDLTARLKAMGVGVTVQDQRYFTGTPGAAGPPFRSLLESGIHMGAGTDSTNAAALDPWVSIYYMTTGRNARGQLINNGQTIPRLAALRMYTTGSAYFSHDDQDLGSVEVGKLADLTVLRDNPLTVTTDQLKQLHAQMTIVGGNVVYTANS